MRHMRQMILELQSLKDVFSFDLDDDFEECVNLMRELKKRADRNLLSHSDEIISEIINDIEPVIQRLKKFCAGENLHHFHCYQYVQACIFKFNLLVSQNEISNAVDVLDEAIQQIEECLEKNKSKAIYIDCARLLCEKNKIENAQLISIEKEITTTQPLNNNNNLEPNIHNSEEQPINQEDKINKLKSSIARTFEKSNNYYKSIKEGSVLYPMYREALLNRFILYLQNYRMKDFAQQFIVDLLPLVREIIFLETRLTDIYYFLAVAYYQLGMPEFSTYVNKLDIMSNPLRDPSLTIFKRKSIDVTPNNFILHHTELRKIFSELRDWQKMEKLFDESLTHTLSLRENFSHVLIRFRQSDKKYIVEKIFLGDAEDAEMRYEHEFDLLKACAPRPYFLKLDAGSSFPKMISMYHPKTLKTLLESATPHSIDLISKTANQIVAAMVWLHAHLKIVHLDMHPGNILLDSNGDVKVTDLGCSMKIDSEITTPLGLPEWQHPAILLASPDHPVRATPAHDLFTFAKIIFLLLHHPTLPNILFTPGTSKEIELPKRYENLVSHRMWSLCKNTGNTAELEESLQVNSLNGVAASKQRKR